MPRKPAGAWRRAWNLVFSKGSSENWGSFLQSEMSDGVEPIGWCLLLGCPAFLIAAQLGFTTVSPGDTRALIFFALLGLGLIRLARRPASRMPKKEHRVKVVNYVGPPEMYFLAICECGWMGDFHDNGDAAFEDARGHSAVVEEEIDQVVG